MSGVFLFVCLFVCLLLLLFFFGGGSLRRSQNFSEKKNFIRHFARFNFLASFISFYFEILSYLACGENLIRLASKKNFSDLEFEAFKQSK